MKNYSVLKKNSWGLRFAWYRKLRKAGYGRFWSISDAIWNAKHFDINGNTFDNERQ